MFCSPGNDRLAGRLLLLATLLSSAACLEQARTPQPLQEVYQPHFRAVPPSEPAADSLAKLAEAWRGPAGGILRSDFRTWQGAALLVSLLVILGIGVDWRQVRQVRHLDLLLLWLTGACLFSSMRFFEDGRLQDPTALKLLDWVFTTVVLLSLAIIARAFFRAARDAGDSWSPRLPATALAALAVALLAVNAAIVLQRPPDDAGEFVNLGGQRLRERGRLPYGDPLLTGTPGAAYGPLLYVAHVPFQIAVSPAPVNERSPARPELGPASTYYAPPVLATQLCTFAFHLAGVLALLLVVRRHAGTKAAFGTVVLYCGSLAVLGIGGAPYAVAGITFVSHIAPAAMTLVALAAAHRPAVAAAVLVAADGVGFYPAFTWPAWLGYYWNDRRARRTFALSSVVSAALLTLIVVDLSRPAGDMTRVETILRDTFGHHTEPGGYGESPFGFWGQREGIREWLMTPLAGSGLTSPAWLLYAALAAGSFRLARGRGLGALASLTGAIALGSAVIKPHATATYLAWYYGPILIGLVLPRAAQVWPGNPTISNSQTSPSRASGSR